MDQLEFRGEYTLHTRGVGGDRYMTLLPDNRVLLLKEKSDRSIFRLYAGTRGSGTTNSISTMLFASRPVKLGESISSWHVGLSFQGDRGRGSLDAGGRGFLFQLDPPQTPSSGNGKAMETRFLVDGKFFLGSKAGRDYPEDDFHLHPVGNQMFQPMPWIVTPVKEAPFNGVQMTYVDFTGQLGLPAEMKDSNLSHSLFNNAAGVGVDFSGSDMTDMGCNNARFGIPGMPESLRLYCKMERTTWRGSGLLNSMFPQARLAGASFVGAFLRFPISPEAGTDLPRPMIQPASFEDADLQGADFTNCDLRYVSFKGADLRRAKFKGATMHETVLTNAWLAGADFTGVDLRQARFETRPRIHQSPPNAGDPKTLFRNAKLKAGMLGLGWISVDLTGATVEEIPTDLKTLQAKYSLLPNCDFSGRDLTDSDFSGSALDGVKFTGAKLIRANLNGLDLKAAVLTNADLSGTKLEGSDLSNLDLSTVIGTPPLASSNPAVRTKLRGTKLKAGLFGKKWTALDFTGAIFLNVKETDLTGMQADNALLIQVNLSGARFNPAVVPATPTSAATETRSSFQQARFHNSNLQQAQLRRAVLKGAQFGSQNTVMRVPLASENANWEDAFAAHGLDSGHGDLLRHAEPGGSGGLLLRREQRADQSFELTLNETSLPANLSGAYLVGADLTNANLEGVTANRAQIYGADDSGAPQLAGAMMSRIRLSDANLGTADLTKAHLEGANLQRANLVGAILSGAWLTPARNGGESIPADLSGAWLAGATFTDARLGGAVLTNAAVPTANGIYLFTLRASLRNDFEACAGKVISPAIGASFAEHFATVAAESKIERLADGRWKLDNESQNPAIFTPGYVIFTIVTEDAGLAVFGNTLRLQRSDAGETEVRQISLTPAVGLNDRVMDDGTYCPNGQRIADLHPAVWNERWLRAPDPPKPPKCIPSRKQFCPPE